ncbi:TauD/TfdA family dioxygenase [Halomonas sp. ML-15]|uniref:TauD/TfdA family dioxygenase n=1 Tax=Halomonas sp. ML-15 TaxID=2773305 RepID=UPI0017462411|nr:TauD/TfdA family dioxygenase [Halomonas sp. ML-15]MBD3894506.1 TauD/TfdA family dioxygenase [Halomonas sp. ML-15]
MSTLAKCRPWLSADVENNHSWIHYISDNAIDDIDRALQKAKSTSKPLLELTPDDFPLSGAGLEEIQAAYASTQHGWGFCLLKGFPVERYSVEDIKTLYWGLGLHAGVARTQNKTSDIMTSVKDTGGQYKVKGGRGYNTNAGLDFHVDFCDVVSLLCIHPAKAGGTSLITSSLAIHDELKRTRPDLEAALHKPFFFSLQGAGADDEPNIYPCPLYGEAQGYPAFRTNRKNIAAAQEYFEEVPRLAADQVEVLDWLDEALRDPKFCFSMNIEKGDMQLLNNYTVVHSRTDFEDYEDDARKRHLLRLWMTIPGSQPLPDSWRDAFKDTRAGAVRGGNRGKCIESDFLDYERRQAHYHGMHNIFSDYR